MPGLAKWLNSELFKGFAVAQVAQKYGRTGRIPAQLIAHMLYSF